MTKQEAIEILLEMAFAERTEFAEDRLFAFGYSKEHEALQIAIECIEKQIPQEAIDYVCPVCGHDMGFDEKNYCSNCGQRIGDNE